MRVVILYHQNSEQAGQVEDYIREFKVRHAEHNIEPLSLETREGAEMARLYDVTNYPAALALDGDGRLLQLWQGPHLPMINELDFYMDY